MMIRGPRPQNAWCSVLFVFVFAYKVFSWSWYNNFSNNRLAVSCCFYGIVFGNSWHVPFSCEHGLSGMTGSTAPKTLNHVRTVPKCSFKDSILLETNVQASGSSSLKELRDDLAIHDDCWQIVFCCFCTILYGGFWESRRSLHAIVFAESGVAPCSLHNIFYGRHSYKRPSVFLRWWIGAIHLLWRLTNNMVSFDAFLQKNPDIISRSKYYI